jgi:hypothetical protein
MWRCLIPTLLNLSALNNINDMAVAILFAFVILLIFSLRTRYSRGLRKFDGPFLASITDFWKLWYALTSSQKQMYTDIHEKYGEIVRVGPNELSFANPKAIRDIYGPKGSSQKVESCACLL